MACEMEIDGQALINASSKANVSPPAHVLGDSVCSCREGHNLVSHCSVHAECLEVITSQPVDVPTEPLCSDPEASPIPPPEKQRTKERKQQPRCFVACMRASTDQLKTMRRGRGKVEGGGECPQRYPTAGWEKASASRAMRYLRAWRPMRRLGFRLGR